MIGSLSYTAIFPTFLTAILAKYVTDHWLAIFHVPHAHYDINAFPTMDLTNLLMSICAGIVFGLTARGFSALTQLIGKTYKKYVRYAPIRPLIGGTIVAALIITFNWTDFAGLGISYIQESFHEQRLGYVFLLKLGLTALTLGAGFKGGEVTPLFFIGATLGNALFLLLPSETIPMDLLAGMGFVAVFAGAANTPIASAIMGIELFGAEGGVYFAIACIVSYYFSGHTGIYGSQLIGNSKFDLLRRFEGTPLHRKKVN